MILCLLLSLAYIPIRINAGGYHASSPMRCYVYSTAIIALLLAILRWFTIPVACSAALFVGSIFLIWKLAPVEAKHNPLDETARRVFKRRTRMLCLAEAVLWLCLLIWADKTLCRGNCARYMDGSMYASHRRMEQSLFQVIESFLAYRRADR